MTEFSKGDLVRGRVIVTYGRSMMALVIAKSLHDRGVEIIGCDDVDMTVLSFSKHVSEYFTHPSRMSDPEGFLDVLVEKVREFRPGDGRPYVLMPSFDGMRFLSQHADRFEGLITLAAPDFDAINKVDPKNHLVSVAKELGLRTPQTFKVSGITKLEEFIDKVSFPVMLKAPDGVGGRGVTKAADAEELKAQFEALGSENALLQEYIEGDDFCHTVLFEHGELKASMAYKNLRQWPRTSGAGVMRETVDDAPFKQQSKKLLAPLKWNGIAEIDYRWSGDEAETAYLIEVNPRFWAGLFHSVASGIDFPWALYELMVTGKVTQEYAAKIGEHSRVPGVALMSAVMDIAESETHFDKVKIAWGHSAERLKEGHVLQGLRLFMRGFGKVFDKDDAAFHLMEMLHDSRDAKSEINFKDDAATNLGFLYILSSILKHNELPPELKH